MENYSLSDLAAVTNDGAFGGGANAWVLIILFALIFGNGFGFGGGDRAATTGDVQRAVDYSALQGSIANVDSEIQRAIYEVNNNTNHVAYDNLGEIRDVQAAVAAGNANIINNLTALQANMQNCCCETKQTIMENRYLDSQNANAIMQNTTAQTQKILDALAQSKIESLQAEVSELKTQNMFCGIPRISNYAYGIYPYQTGCSCNNI